MKARTALLALLATGLLGAWSPGVAGAEEECALSPRSACFGVESVSASLSSSQPGVPATQAGAHPDLSFEIAIKRDPLSAPNVFGIKDTFAATRDIRIETPPGLIGDPNVLGVPQQCTAQELFSFNEPGGGCPNGSQVGLTTIAAYDLAKKFREPLYMMVPPGGEVVARLGTIAGVYPTFIDIRVRSEDQQDFGLTAEVTDAPAQARLVAIEATLWGVPAAPAHDNERCTPAEVFTGGCVTSPTRDPGSRELPFLTNPTRCGVPLEVRVNATSWFDPAFLASRQASTLFPAQIGGCDSLPYGPSLSVEPTSRRTSSPTGVEVTIAQPPAEGVAVLEPSHTRDIRVELPLGVRVNPGSADGLGVCSAAQVRFEQNVASQCPDSAKLAATEFEVTGLPRRMRGAIYLREPEPGNLFRVWIVADDLGAHVKLPGRLELDRQSGQIGSVVLDSPQVPMREVKLFFKSGFRAPLLTPDRCGEYRSGYEFVPWSGGPQASGSAPMQISEGCEPAGFSPELSAGSTDARAAAHSPFTFTIRREDSEANITGLAVTLPRGVSASFAGIARCEGADAQSGHCPPASRIGRVTVADGAGPAPLWVPQPGKDPTAVYLAGPYKGAPLSIVAVVPAQAGPFDLGLEVVRTAVFVDPVSAQARAVADPLPQFIEGIPILYRTINVTLDRPGFVLNPTSCARKETRAELSAGARSAVASAPFAASDCARLGFKPRLSLKLKGGAKRGSHPAFTATFRPRQGDANAKAIVVRLPRSAFLDQAHIRTICTRVQFAAGEGNGAQCPPGSRYGKVSARTPLLDFPLEGEVFLRSSNHNLPDMVLTLHGPPSMPIEIEASGRIDSVRGGIRSSFEAIPDAPLTEVTLQMQGGAKGLIVNSRNLCAGKPSRAEVALGAHNGRRATLRPVVEATKCGTGRKGKRGDEKRRGD